MSTGELIAESKPSDELAPFPVGGSRNTPSRLMLLEPEISSGHDGPLCSCIDFTYH